MPAFRHSQASLLELLHSLKINFVCQDHPAVFTVAESQQVRATLGQGRICKCLFLKSREGLYWLFAVPAEQRVDLKKLAGQLECGRLHFAPAEDLEALLGLLPGAVSLLGLVNDQAGRVGALIEESLLENGRPLYFHPLVNTASLALQPADLLRFLEHIGHRPRLVRTLPEEEK